MLAASYLQHSPMDTSEVPAWLELIASLDKAQRPEQGEPTAHGKLRTL